MTLTFFLAPALHGKWRKNQLAKLKSTFLPDLAMKIQPVVEKKHIFAAYFYCTSDDKQDDLFYHVGQHGNLFQPHLKKKWREDLEKSKVK